MRDRQRKTTQRGLAGFTLIELVIVITIIGILAAIALPRFVNLQREARISKLNSVRGAVSSASALIHSAFLTKNGAPDTVACPGTSIIANNVTSLCTESGVVAINFGYPATTDIPASALPGIVGAAGLTTVLNPNLAQLQAEGYNVTRVANDTIFQIQGAPDLANCQFVYTQSIAAGAAPVIGTTLTNGC